MSGWRRIGESDVGERSFKNDNVGVAPAPAPVLLREQPANSANSGAAPSAETQHGVRRGKTFVKNYVRVRAHMPRASTTRSARASMPLRAHYACAPARCTRGSQRRPQHRMWSTRTTEPLKRWAITQRARCARARSMIELMMRSSSSAHPALGDSQDDEDDDDEDDDDDELFNHATRKGGAKAAPKGGARNQAYKRPRR